MGTTTNKLSYLTETKEKIAEKIIDLGGDIIEQTTFREYTNELQTVYNNAPKVNSEGSNIELENCAKGKMVIQPRGNTTQNDGASLDNPQTIKNVTGNNKVKIKELLLPDEYQQVEYIESTSTQYINPEIITDLNEVYWYVKFALTELKGNGPYNSYNCILGLDNNPQIAAYQNGWTVGNNGSNLPYPPQINVKYEATLNKNGNGGLNIDGQATGISRFINSVTPTIFDINANASKAKIYNVKYIRLSDNVVLNNFVPCYRKSDDEIGMYDIVNDVFYTNAGTGTFLKGEDYPIIEKELNLISKNVLQLKKNYTWTSNGITVSTGDDDIITINGTVSSNLSDARIFLFDNHYYVRAGEVYTNTIKYISGTITPPSAKPNNTGLFYLRSSDTLTGFEYQFNINIGFLKVYDINETITVVNTGNNKREGYINSMQLMAQQGTVFNNYKIKIQLEKNNTPTEYEPYYNYELCKIGNNQDYFYKDYSNNKWYGKKEIDKIESYNGETITTQYVSTTGGLDIGATIYYVLNNPIYIEITEETLINQLESLNRTIIQVPTINIETESDVDNAQLIVNASALKSS